MRMLYLHCPNCEIELELEESIVEITCQNCGDTFAFNEALIDYETEDSLIPGKNKWSKNKGSEVWWTNDTATIGSLQFSFDKEKIFYLFKDYPNNLAVEEKEKFDRSESFWVNFFEDLN